MQTLDNEWMPQHQLNPQERLWWYFLFFFKLVPFFTRCSRLSALHKVKGSIILSWALKLITFSSMQSCFSTRASNKWEQQRQRERIWDLKTKQNSNKNIQFFILKIIFQQIWREQPAQVLDWLHFFIFFISNTPLSKCTQLLEKSQVFSQMSHCGQWQNSPLFSDSDKIWSWTFRRFCYLTVFERWAAEAISLTVCDFYS